MRGRGQAILVVAVNAVLSVLVPPLSWLSGAALALVTLRKGATEGAVVIAGALVGAALLAYLTVGSAMPAGSFLLVLWLPTWAVACVLRGTVSLATALESAAGLGLLAVLALHLLLGDATGWWSELLLGQLRAVEAELEAQQVEIIRGLIEYAVPYMTGLLVAAGLINLLIGLLFGRAWQARLYNPGGFRREFHALRLHRVTATVTAAVLLLVLVQGGPGLVTDLGAVLAVVYALAGLAAVHALVRLRGGGRVAWLVAVYLLLAIRLPEMTVALAALGLLNAWMDFGRLLGGKPGAADS